jgi:hypothetical protein
MCDSGKKMWRANQARHPGVDFYQMDCTQPGINGDFHGKTLCEQALSRAPGNHDEPLYMEWVGAANWQPMARGLPMPQRQFSPRITAAIERGSDDDALVAQASSNQEPDAAVKYEASLRVGLAERRARAGAVVGAPVVLPVYW